MRLIRLILKGVGVHRVERQSDFLGLAVQIGRRLRVPWDMQRNRGRGSGQAMDDAAVVQLVEHIARLARAGETGEAGAAGSHTPTGHGDAIGGDLVLDGRDVDAASVQIFAQSVIIRPERRGGLVVGLLDDVRFDHGGVLYRVKA